MSDQYLDTFSKSCIPISTQSQTKTFNEKSDQKIETDLNLLLNECNKIESFQQSRHICVISRGIIFKFDVFGEENKLSLFSKQKLKLYSFNKIAKTLYLIQKESNKIVENCFLLSNNENYNYNAVGIGSLTTLPRKEWAQLRCHLLNLSVQNKQNLHDIESALFVICLDNVANLDIYLNDNLYNDKHHSIKNYLCNNPTNRWFDKSTQIVVNNINNAAILNNIACCNVSLSSRLISEVSMIEKVSPQLYESSDSPIGIVLYSIENKN